MSYRHLYSATALLLASVAAPTGRAAELDAAAVQQVVAQSTAEYAALVDKRDAAGLAALFTPQAEYVDSDGVVFHGRDAVQAEFAAQFAAGLQGKFTIEVTSIRPIADGLIVEEGATTFRPAGEGPVSQGRYLALHARQSAGNWLLAAVRELGPPELSAHEQLKSLAWLVGDWREELAGSVVQTSWRWSDDGVALLAEFTTKDASGDSRRGTHRIGWDAERKQFRSWIFDSTGGFVEGYWTSADDGTWSVQLHGVDSDGLRIGGLLTYVVEGADRLTITQSGRTRDGVALPPVSNRVVRRPPAAVVPAKS